MLGIAGTLHINLRNRAFDIAQIGGRQLDARPAYILSQPALLRRARDRHDPRPLRQQPGQRYLRRGHLFLLGDIAKHLDQTHVRLSVFF